MLYHVHKPLDKPASFMHFKGRFLLIPVMGAVLSLVASLIIQVFIPALLAIFLCILLVLIPSIVIGLRLQDKIREKELGKFLFSRRRNLRVSIPPSSIKREYTPSVLAYIVMTNRKNNTHHKSIYIYIMTTTKLNNLTILDALSIRLIQENFIISEDGSITVGYELNLPVWGESSDSEITSMISSFKKALKALPD